jgi:hypothetical protein
MLTDISGMESAFKMRIGHSPIIRQNFIKEIQTPTLDGAVQTQMEDKN